MTDDMAHARDQVRWFPALVSNHVVDLVKRYEPKDLPQALTDYIKAREHYDYADHGRTGAEHASFVPDEVVDRFCVLGPAEECVAKLEDLAPWACISSTSTRWWTTRRGSSGPSAGGRDAASDSGREA